MDIKDLVIIGGGPAGLSAAVYGKRAMLDEVVIEKDVYGGGQIALTDRVDNYLGLYGESGYDIAMKFKQHAKSIDVPFVEGEVIGIKNGDVKQISLASGEILYANAVVISTGARYKKLGCKGEGEFRGIGVSYCATCDGAFFRNKKVAVVGGGNVALADALYLSNLCEKVYLIHRREELRGAKDLQDKIFQTENIKFLPKCEITEIYGKETVEGVTIKDGKNDNIRKLEVSGVFVAVGMEPNVDMVKDLLLLDNNGYIVADESCRCSEKGFYAVGDVRTKQLRQLITAVADGAVAISSLEQDRNNQ